MIRWDDTRHRALLELRKTHSASVAGRLLGLTRGQVLGHERQVRERGWPYPEHKVAGKDYINRVRTYSDQISVQLDAETYREIEAIAKKEKRPRAHVMRDLLDWGLIEYYGEPVEGEQID